MSDHQTPNPHDDTVPRLDTLRDMDPICIGDLSQKHMGLHISIELKSKRRFYGRIISIHHEPHTTLIHARWNGQLYEYRGDPELVARLETTIDNG